MWNKKYVLFLDSMYTPKYCDGFDQRIARQQHDKHLLA